MYQIIQGLKQLIGPDFKINNSWIFENHMI
jgi:hypothetical protein